MHALTFHGTKNICYESSNDPVLLEPGDAIVKISLAGICGSDLHVYLGRESGLDAGTVMGHEFVGEIVETGSAVNKFHKGNKVLSPFTTSCGECFYCLTGLTCRCEKGNLYGWVQQGKGLHGGQAEYVRVPMADTTLVPLSNDLNEEQGLLLGDVFSTGYYCADRASIHSKGTYAVIGCGSVGLMAVVAAKHLGAENLYAVDTLPERLNEAQSFGALPLNANAINVTEYIFNITHGRGADAVLEAVGSPGSLRLAIELVRPGGIISSVGVHTSNQFAFSPIEAYDKNLTYLSGRCPARYYAEKLIREEVVQRYDITSIITHRFALQDGSRAYQVFDKKEDNCIKAVLLP
ncbi:MAG: alcohol dehydrogenase family protein [Chitinophagaceae bacterium]|nr:alcohol dehydrogenase family protein [Chitinophagaceae bacterium]